jgi:hypothetical protein
MWKMKHILTLQTWTIDMFKIFLILRQKVTNFEKLGEHFMVGLPEKGFHAFDDSPVTDKLGKGLNYYSGKAGSKNAEKGQHGNLFCCFFVAILI